MKMFMFMYLLIEDTEKVKTHLGRHVSYWKNLEFGYFKNGPFADKSGGLIIFSADSRAAAEKIIAQDPLLTGNAIRQYWLKEWVA